MARQLLLAFLLVLPLGLIRADAAFDDPREIDEGPDEDSPIGGPDFDDEEYERRRRLPIMRAYMVHRSPYHVEEDQDAFDRKRRIPYFYPSRLQNYQWETNEDLDDDDYMEDDKKKRTVMRKRDDEDDEYERKRRVPYFYPFYFQRRNELKRFSSKRQAPVKRSLVDTVRNDDVSNFGYDKRKRGGEEYEDEKKKRQVMRKRS